MPSTVVNRRVVLSGGGYISPRLLTWYNSLITKPSSGLLNDLNILIDGIFADNDYVELDLFHPIGGLETNEQRLRPIISTSGSDFTNVNSATLDTTGVTGNGTTSYVNINWNPNTNGVKHTQNLACIGVYNRTNRVAASVADIGCFTLAPNKLTRIYPFIGTTMIGSLSAASDSSATVASSHGFSLAIRTTSTLTTLYRNTTTLGTDNDVSDVPPNLNMFICGVNNAGALSAASTDNLSLVLAGSGSVNAVNVYNRIQTYMTSRGINV